jgi:hypothetical protein
MSEPVSSRSGASGSFALEPLLLPTFTLHHDVHGSEVTVRLRGNADSDVAAAFAHYLDRLHHRMVEAKSRELVFDFRELYFLTSSCIKCLVVAIKRVMTMEARTQYKIRLLTTPALRWQERSFEVLCQMAPMLVTRSDD